MNFSFFIINTKASRILYVALACMVCFSCTKETVDDDGLTIEEYLKRGVPDPEKRWTMEEFSQARVALGKIKWDQPYHLPRKGSKKSGPLFDHMLSLDNMYFLRDTKLSLNEKAEHISAFVSVYDYWIDVYSNPVINKGFYSRERLYIDLFNLGVMEQMVQLALAIQDSDEPSAVALQYGVPSIKSNYLASLKTNLKTQSNSSHSPETDLDALADSVYSSVMKNKEWMDSAARSELKSAIHLILQSPSSDHVRDKYTQLESAL